LKIKSVPIADLLRLFEHWADVFWPQENFPVQFNILWCEEVDVEQVLKTVKAQLDSNKDSDSKSNC